jgi:hypothetical protein
MIAWALDDARTPPPETFPGLELPLAELWQAFHELAVGAGL